MNEGGQIFVRTEETDAVERAIRDYVREHGCTAFSDTESDRPSRLLAERSERHFLLSRPRDGFITIWEDGNWGDRRLAQALSAALACKAHMLLVSNSTDSWGYAAYEDGKETARESNDVDDPEEAAARYASDHDLPYAIVYLDDPNLRRWVQERAAPDSDDEDDEEITITAEDLEAERRWHEEHDEPVDETKPEDADDLSPAELVMNRWQDDFDRDRGGFSELVLPC